MIINNELRNYNRHSIRLKGFDYAKPRLYFVTICVQSRQPLFGNVCDGKMVLNDAGEMVKSCWEQIHQRYPSLSINQYVVMPNHFHAIVDLSSSDGTISMPSVIGAFKSISTNEYISGVRRGLWMPFEKRLWQRNYYEHIVRGLMDYCRIIKYIQNNPVRWCAKEFEKEIPFE